MDQSSTYNILMYSHDTYGLGHIRRTMAIAAHLRRKDTNILIITGSPIAGRFSFPEQIDFVRIPGMIKMTNEEYLPLSIKINPRLALDIRKNIIFSTAKTFRPHLFIVDKEPLGLKKEVLPTLEWLSEALPDTKTILGLRDVMDDAETVQRDWQKRGVYDILDRLYSEVWIYGNKDFYDPIKEYAIPEPVNRKIVFTGYIPRKVPDISDVSETRRTYSPQKNGKLVVVTTGGGGDGYAVMDAYVSMLESLPAPPPFNSVLVTGPFMPKPKRIEIYQRAKEFNVQVYHFYRQMEKIIAAADLVISMGGYNTLCEILSQGTVNLVIPRETPRKEQLIRAKVFHKKNLLDYIPWNELSPEAICKKVFDLLEKPESYKLAISRFKMTGFEIMRQRLSVFRKNS